jgi:hypothetical protein
VCRLQISPDRERAAAPELCRREDGAAEGAFRQPSARKRR